MRETTKAPGVAGESDVPDAPDTADALGAADATGAPGATDAPGAADALGAADAADRPGAPDAPGTADAPCASDAAGASGVLDAMGAATAADRPGLAGASGAPGAADRPSAATTADATGAPGATGRSGESDALNTAAPDTADDAAAAEGEDAASAAAPDAAPAAPNAPHPHRPVFSFVRRSSHLEPRMQRAWDDYAPRYLLPIPTRDGRTLTVAPDFRLTRDWAAEAWGADRPLVMEIGTGQGENIVAAAQHRPDVNFLAVEVYDPGVAHTLLRAGKEGLGNLRVAQVNAPELVAACAWGVIDELWTFFPDPWPKMKHHKRRLIQPALAADAHAALKRGGLWRIATDIDDYALHVHEVMDTAPGFANVGTRTASLPTRHVGKGNAGEAASLPHADFTESERFEGRVLTNFERKGLDAGRTIHDLTYQAV